MSRFANVTDKLDFANEEERTLAYWTEIDAFQTSLKLSEGKPEYTFYDGPPFATGLPHYGHILAGTIKDTVTRYAHQTGHYVSRRFGWDCHGLPVEYEIDKKLKITGRDMVLEMGVANYNKECRLIWNVMWHFINILLSFRSNLWNAEFLSSMILDRLSRDIHLNGRRQSPD